ncbi:MAG: HNH endonuclease [Alkaliphilus sp.]|nr:HNH endonuclease [Alkaliphilus sp.]
MPVRPRRPCAYPGCPELVGAGERYCSAHRKQEQKYYDKQRGTANERGYTYRWNKYSKWFLSQSENQVCKLRLDKRCKLIAECVDHIVPPSGPNDSLFWDEKNHQASCLVCNSIKGRKAIRGSEWEI